MFVTPVKKLNWGCSGHVASGWINSDVKRGRSVNVACDILQGLALRSDSFDYAVSVHALQEIPYGSVTAALQELRRVLKPGGVLRLVLPDLDKGIDAYRRGDAGYFVVPDSDVKSLGGRFIVQMLWYGYSRTLFTADFIEELLLVSGFTGVAHCAYAQTASAHPGIVELDNREGESLFVEATK